MVAWKFTSNGRQHIFTRLLYAIFYAMFRFFIISFQIDLLSARQIIYSINRTVNAVKSVTNYNFKSGFWFNFSQTVLVLFKNRFLKVNHLKLISIVSLNVVIKSCAFKNESLGRIPKYLLVFTRWDFFGSFSIIVLRAPFWRAFLHICVCVFRIFSSLWTWFSKEQTARGRPIGEFKRTCVPEGCFSDCSGGRSSTWN